MGRAIRSTCAAQHFRSRNEILDETSHRLLLHVLESGEEEQLVAVLVEARARNNHRATQSASRIVVAICGGFNAIVIQPPIVGLEGSIARVHISATVEVLAAALANGLESHGA